MRRPAGRVRGLAPMVLDRWRFFCMGPYRYHCQQEAQHACFLDTSTLDMDNCSDTELVLYDRKEIRSEFVRNGRFGEKNVGGKR